MRYFEDENWWYKKIPMSKNIPRVDKFLVLDSQSQPHLQGLPKGAVPIINSKLKFLGSPSVVNKGISLYFKLYPKQEEKLSSAYHMQGQDLKDYLNIRTRTIYNINRLFSEGVLPGHIAELPYPNK